VTAVGQLTPRRLADEAIAFLAVKQTPEIKETVAQASARIRIRSANAERLAAELGEATEEAWVTAVRRKLDEPAGRTLPDIRQEWSALWRTLADDVLELVRRLRERYGVGLLSNATDRLGSELRDYHKIDGLFRVIINSSQVGVAKPDPRIYQLAAERMGVPPEGCVHIDDLEHNVEGARQAGFYGIHHRGDYPALERELRSLGVEW
jgi:putative hydrolase of the HAD superfamily